MDVGWEREIGLGIGFLFEGKICGFFFIKAEMSCSIFMFIICDWMSYIMKDNDGTLRFLWKNRKHETHHPGPASALRGGWSKRRYIVTISTWNCSH